MGETFTKQSTTVINHTQMKEAEVHDNLDADELIFYHSIRAELDLLKKVPKLQTIPHILDHSKSLR